jgi:ABC-type hemin transport system substrate-binding protein
VDLTPAGKNGRIYRVDETEVMYYGPRTPDAVKHIAGMLHPESTNR